MARLLCPLLKKHQVLYVTADPGPGRRLLSDRARGKRLVHNVSPMKRDAPGHWAQFSNCMWRVQCPKRLPSYGTAGEALIHAHGCHAVKTSGHLGVSGLCKTQHKKLCHYESGSLSISRYYQSCDIKHRLVFITLPEHYIHHISWSTLCCSLAPARLEGSLRLCAHSASHQRRSPNAKTFNRSSPLSSASASRISTRARTRPRHSRAAAWPGRSP